MTKARANATAASAKGDLVVGSGTNASTTLAVASTAGYVLTVDSSTTSGLKWAAASSGALTFISTQTFSGASSYSFDNIFTSTYENYQIIITLDSVTGQQSFTMKLRASGSDTSANYDGLHFYANNEGVGTNYNGAGTDEWGTIINDGTNGSTDKGMANIYLIKPQVAEITQILLDYCGYDNQGESQRGIMSGYQNSTTQFDGIKLIAGNTFTGRITFYGLQKS